jgi:hypothetical protein
VFEALFTIRASLLTFSQKDFLHYVVAV